MQRSLVRIENKPILLTFGSRIFRSRLFSTLPLLVLAASRRNRARSTRASVGLSNIDGVRLGGPEFVSDVTNILMLFPSSLIANQVISSNVSSLEFGAALLLRRFFSHSKIVSGTNEQKCQWCRSEKHKFQLPTVLPPCRKLFSVPRTSASSTCYNRLQKFYIRTYTNKRHA